MDAVVNRHDRAAAHGDRQHIMRRVIHVRLLAHQHPRHVNLFADGVVVRGFEDGAEVLAKCLGHAHVRLVAEQDVLVLPIDARQMPQEVPDVGADAEIVQFSGINGHSHR